jgi:hypothetical protein
MLRRFIRQIRRKNEEVGLLICRLLPKRDVLACRVRARRERVLLSLADAQADHCSQVHETEEQMPWHDPVEKHDTHSVPDEGEEFLERIC